MHAGIQASTINTPESSLAKGLQFLLTRYSKENPTRHVDNWSELASVAGSFDGLNSVLKSGSVTDYFAFVPLNSRGKFPAGNLILVQIQPMPWPDAWKTEDPKKPGEYVAHSRHQDIRFLIYEKDGRFIAERWYETKFQAMLAETGLTVPPLTPYSPPPSTSAAPVIASKAAPAVAPPATPTPAPVSPPPVKSSNPLWWIAGAIVALVSVTLALGRKKFKD